VTSGHIRTRQYLAAASGSSSGYEDIFIVHDPISTLSPLPDERRGGGRIPLPEGGFAHFVEANNTRGGSPVQKGSHPGQLNGELTMKK
jgi:hypothetical protein